MHETIRAICFQGTVSSAAKELDSLISSAQARTSNFFDVMGGVRGAEVRIPSETALWASDLAGALLLFPYPFQRRVYGPSEVLDENARRDARLALQACHELAHLFQDARNSATEGLSASAAELIRASIEEKNDDFRLLGGRSGLLEVYDIFAFKDAAGHPGSVRDFAIGGYVPDFSDRTCFSLSKRAFERVWDRIAAALAETGIDDYRSFVATFRVALIQAVRREAGLITRFHLRFGGAPSTCYWVHRFSLHTGLSPPDLSNAKESIVVGVERIDQGGLNGPLRRRKTGRNLQSRSHLRRSSGRVLSHPAKTAPSQGDPKQDYPMGGGTTVRYAWRSDRRSGHTRLGDQLRLVRRGGSICDAARTLMVSE